MAKTLNKKYKKLIDKKGTFTHYNQIMNAFKNEIGIHPSQYYKDGEWRIDRFHHNPKNCYTIVIRQATKDEGKVVKRLEKLRNNPGFSEPIENPRMIVL